ncbi:hypothetical protein [Parahaliea mediterranea]|uniref:hypothetical protein n=1 Tax=Parahaliea mediterranea TaxID=651086 RepID=UPI0013003AD5|nr:hypothetical protein [Parahaliea mediterranea]
MEFEWASIWGWMLVSAFVKLGIALAPTLAKEHEFNCENWDEAKEVAAVSATRALLTSTPVVLFIQTFQRTDTICAGGVDPLLTLVAFLLISFLAYIFLQFPVWCIKGRVIPFLLLVVLVVSEVVFGSCFLDGTSSFFCES